ATEQAENSDDPRGERIRQFLAKASDSHRPHRQDQDPEEKRSFMRAPDRRELVDGRQGKLRVVGNVENRKVAGEKRIGEAHERDNDKHELPERGRPCHRHHRRIAAVRAEQGHRSLAKCERQREDQREMSDLRNQLSLPARAAAAVAWRCLASDSATSGGMSVSSCFASTVSATNCPPSFMRPCARIPCPSRNRSGNTPLETTGSWFTVSVNTNCTS